MIKAVLFDLIGTTVKTSDPDFILNCFQKAFLKHGIATDFQVLKNNRGKRKLVMIQEVLMAKGLTIDIAPEILITFNNVMHESMNNFSDAEGLSEVFSALAAKEIYIGIGTGLSEALFDSIFHHLAWEKYKISYIGIADKLGVSRPDPGMIYDMMKKLSIDDTSQFLKVGDTKADIQEGKNAGVPTAVILAGTQNKEELLMEKPDFVITSLSEVLQINKFHDI